MHASTVVESNTYQHWQKQYHLKAVRTALRLAPAAHGVVLANGLLPPNLSPLLTFNQGSTPAVHRLPFFFVRGTVLQASAATWTSVLFTMGVLSVCFRSVTVSVVVAVAVATANTSPVPVPVLKGVAVAVGSAMTKVFPWTAVAHAHAPHG